MEKARPKWMAQIDLSFLSDAMKKQYKPLIEERFDRIG